MQSQSTRISSTASLTQELRKHRLFSESQLDELEHQLQPRCPDARALARELIQRGWLTPFQVNVLLGGRGQSLLLGPYVLLERLGEGGTGQVFKARHQHMKRVAAVKLIRRELLADSEVVSRFLREIQVVSQLSHPNVVHAYDAGPIGRTYFLAMEYVEGIDLAALVRRSGPLPVTQACDYLRQAALGLQHAHERRLVHRDIKPANFLVTNGRTERESAENTQFKTPDASASSVSSSLTLASPWGVVKLVDLGLARLHRTVDGDKTSMMTPAGPMTMGTPDYLAPEQALDFHRADIRSDIYGLGCAGYYLLTGQPPFPGGSLAQKLLCHQQVECPALERFRPETPAHLSTILRRMMAKRPEDRYQTPQEIADALAPLLGLDPDRGGDDQTVCTEVPSNLDLSSTQPGSDVPWVGIEGGELEAGRGSPGRLKRRLIQTRWAWLSFAGLLVTIGLFGALLARQSSELPAQNPSTITASPETISPREWKDVLAAWDDPRAEREHLRLELLRTLQTEAGTARAFQAAGMLRQLRSPLDRLDPKAIPAEKRSIWNPPELVAVLGELRSQGGPEGLCLAFSADGMWLASGWDDKRVRLWRLQNLGEPVVLPRHTSALRSVVLAPDGRTLASIGVGELTPTIWDLTGMAPRECARLGGHTRQVRGVAFAPDARSAASVGMDGSIRFWDLTRNGCPEVGRARASNERVLAVAASPDGKTWASACPDHTVELWDARRNGPGEPTRTTLPGHQGDHLHLAYSSDGKLLVSSGQGGEFGLRVWDVTREPPRQLWGVKGRNILTTALSPDGRLLAVCYGNGEVSIYTASNGVKGQGWHWPHGVHGLDFAADGRHLALANTNGTISILRLATLTTAK